MQKKDLNPRQVQKAWRIFLEMRTPKFFIIYKSSLMNTSLLVHIETASHPPPTIPNAYFFPWLRQFL